MMQAIGLAKERPEGAMVDQGARVDGSRNLISADPPKADIPSLSPVCALIADSGASSAGAFPATIPDDAEGRRPRGA